MINSSFHKPLVCPMSSWRNKAMMNGLMPEPKQTPLLADKKRSCQWQFGDSGDPRSGLWGMPPREARWWSRITIRGKIKCPLRPTLTSLYMQALAPLARRISRKGTLIAYFLAVSVGNPGLEKQIPLAACPSYQARRGREKWELHFFFIVQDTCTDGRDIFWTCQMFCVSGGWGSTVVAFPKRQLTNREPSIWMAVLGNNGYE
jgi:hypothetical protein